MTGELWDWDDDPEELLAVLRRGGVLGIPTESSYGLGADPSDARGMAAIFEAKGRAAEQALPVVVADLEQAAALGVERDAPGLDALAALWPAPVSLVVPIARPLPASAGGSTLAIRIPDHARLRTLLRRIGPLTATSANRSGEPPLLDPRATSELLGAIDHRVIDDGILPGGAPSTLVRWVGGGFRVVRSGRFPAEGLPSGAPGRDR
ncbi:MAG TPA: L-threonylcarbamoyladenylate synthase [Thermoanaerobaculia bacterium]|nr:L-threonylcarbamoyladenylate synthase [Thermoanaerobaculia bacterium]